MKDWTRDFMNEHYQTATLITEKLKHEGPCVCESLLAKLSSSAWNGVFTVIDALYREGTITLQPEDRFRAGVSLPSHDQESQYVGARDSCETRGRAVGRTQNMAARHRRLVIKTVDEIWQRGLA